MDEVDASLTHVRVMKRKIIPWVLLGIPASLALLLLGFIGLMWINFNAPDQGWEFGYYGQFNRVKHVIEEMPDVTIVDSWQHKDISLEDFGFTLLLHDGDTVDVKFFDGTSEKTERNRKKIKSIVQRQIDSNKAKQGIAAERGKNLITDVSPKGFNQR